MSEVDDLKALVASQQAESAAWIEAKIAEGMRAIVRERNEARVQLADARAEIERWKAIAAGWQNDEQWDKLSAVVEVARAYRKAMQAEFGPSRGNAGIELDQRLAALDEGKE